MASIDWLTIVLYLALLAMGWMSICGACYEYGEPKDLLSLASFSTRTGMQLVWIASSIVLGVIVLMLDDRIFDTFAYLIYGVLLILLFATPFLTHDIKGSLSWIKVGSFSIQPAEFAKFATSLALAKFMGTYGFRLQGSWKNLFMCIALMVVPMVLIVLQKETGSALVYLSLFLMLYREGMPGSVLFIGIAAVAYIIVGLRFSEIMLLGGLVSLGDVLVVLMIILFSLGMVFVYCRPSALIKAQEHSRSTMVSLHSLRLRRYFYIGLFAIGSLAIHVSASTWPTTRKNACWCSSACATTLTVSATTRFRQRLLSALAALRARDSSTERRRN